MLRASSSFRTRGALLALTLAACGGEPRPADPIHFSDLLDGAYLAGTQTTQFTVETEEHGVRSAELYLDGLRIATDELAPFELTWDTHAFDEGEHELRVHALLDDDSALDTAIGIHIDNTPPFLDGVPTLAVTGAPYEISASDNELLDRVEVARVADGVSGVPVVLDRPPYAFDWTFGCGTATLAVRAIDAAGLVTEGTFDVTAGNLDDADCDGFTSSDDCDDLDASVHPGAPRGTDGRDHDCDGLSDGIPGDLDQDGVPGTDQGGDDCNDADPTIHGAFYTINVSPLESTGAPFTWPHGAAAAGYVQGEGFYVYRNRQGVIDRSSLVGTAVEPVATGANPGSVGAAGEFVAFGRGHDIVVEKHGPGGWSVSSTVHTDADVGKVAFLDRNQNGSSSFFYLAYQSGTRVFFASSPDLGAWSTQELLDAGAPLAEAPGLHAYDFGAHIVFHTADAAWLAQRDGAAGELVITSMNPQNMPVQAVADWYGSYELIAVADGGGSSVYDGNGTTIAWFASPVTALVADYDSVFIRLATGELHVLRSRQGFRHLQTIGDVPDFDFQLFGLYFGSGKEFYLSTPDVTELNGDGIDSNCDGFDD